ncbi:hypothetical protein MmiAt1_06360 [Methanimicrococcus sp. At1]|uniref:Uncharacterized protein n=1 Tax=Methanimicrococcus hacksteinii TaxID=3028293 RepID=A0ABU3VNU5_9EURY|nr:hypothetical protein [Methanimicrococcus sp. At1]
MRLFADLFLLFILLLFLFFHFLIFSSFYGVSNVFKNPGSIFTIFLNFVGGRLGRALLSAALLCLRVAVLPAARRFAFPRASPFSYHIRSLRERGHGCQQVSVLERLPCHFRFAAAAAVVRARTASFLKNYFKLPAGFSSFSFSVLFPFYILCFQADEHL